MIKYMVNKLDLETSSRKKFFKHKFTSLKN